MTSRGLEAVHLLFDFETFVTLLAVDTRWLEQSLRIRHAELLGGGQSAEPADYLEKIIQVPLFIEPLDEQGVVALISGLSDVGAHPEKPAHAAGALPAAPAPGQHGIGGLDSGPALGPTTGGPADNRPSEGETPAAGGGPAATTAPTSAADELALPSMVPASVLQLTDNEVGWLTQLGPLAGSTPRTVKRFLNTYRLLKARSPDPAAFARDPVAVAFLVALVTGQPAAADDILAAARAPGAPRH